MAALTKETIDRILGPVDAFIAAQIIATAATEEDLLEAQAWVTSDEALVNDLRPLPKGVVADLIDILDALESPEDT